MSMPETELQEISTLHQFMFIHEELNKLNR